MTPFLGGVGWLWETEIQTHTRTKGWSPPHPHHSVSAGDQALGSPASLAVGSEPWNVCWTGSLGSGWQGHSGLRTAEHRPTPQSWALSKDVPQVRRWLWGGGVGEGG